MLLELPSMQELRNDPSHAEIAALAEQIYIASGRKPGQDVENWLTAEAFLKAGVQPETPPQAVQSPSPGKSPELRKKKSGQKSIALSVASS
jgi:hypothetical protein